MEEPGFWYDRSRFASRDEAIDFIRHVVGLDEPGSDLEGCGIDLRADPGVPQQASRPAKELPPFLRVIPGGRR